MLNQEAVRLKLDTGVNKYGFQGNRFKSLCDYLVSWFEKNRISPLISPTIWGQKQDAIKNGEYFHFEAKQKLLVDDEVRCLTANTKMIEPAPKFNNLGRWLDNYQRIQTILTTVHRNVR